MADQHYSFEDLKTLVLPNEHIDVQDSETGETKTVKTVSRAEVAAIVAYMLGLDDEHLEEYYSHHYAQLLQSLRSDKNATIIRYLCSIRTILMNNFLQVDNEMRYNLSNLDRMKYFNREEISQLDKWGVHVIQPNYRSDKYIYLLTELPKYGHTPTREQLEALMPWSDSLPDFCKKKYSQVESVTIPEMSLCKAKV